MALDRRKGLQTAERLLKQGKLKAALSELQRVSEAAPNDLLTLNRLGDLLARQGRNEEAIGYYDTIAERFAGGGFLPKAIAMHKKILRLDPNRLASMVALGSLYMRQRLHGEARSYLLHAASQYLVSKEFSLAREVYETLVEAEPDDPRHRVRLAETRAAEGDLTQAAGDLVGLGRSLLDAGELDEAQKIFTRATEIQPDAPDAVLGLVECLGGGADAAQATALLEQACSPSNGTPATPALIGELAARYAAEGRLDEAMKRFEGTRLGDIPVATWQVFFRSCLGRDSADEAWSRLDPLFEAEATQSDSDPLAEILESLGELETQGYLPALQRLLDLQDRRGDSHGKERALEWLVRAYRQRAMEDEADAMLERLRQHGSESPLLGGDAQTIEADSAVESPTIELTEPAAPSIGPSNLGDLPDEYATPAVPLTKADQEFVAGRVTQAEVLEKYGLRQQALDQLEEVANKFPGHIDAMRRRTEMFSESGNDAPAADALAQLALALRAAGESDEAVKIARQAAGIASIDGRFRTLLAQAGLVGLPAAPAAAAEPVVTTPVEAPTVAAPPAAVSAPPAPIPAAGEVDLLAGFDDGESDPAAAETPVAADAPTESIVVPTAHEPAAEAVPAEPELVAAPPRPSGPPTRMPSADMIEEIEGYIAARDTDEAGRRVQALRTLGYASERLDALETQVAALVESEQEAVPEVSAADLGVTPELLDTPSLAADDDLSAITAALEAELFDGESHSFVPEEDAEQSLDEVFATFKQHVQEQVGTEDYRTHYDLGIAYKEMGMTSEAVEEFEQALDGPDLRRDASTMIAVCRRELGDAAESAVWYRKAIEAAGNDPAVTTGLRYDLAEVLLEAGETDSALDLFRDLMNLDPGFRDVAGRVQQLETAV